MLVPNQLTQENLKTWAFRNGFDLTKNFAGETISPDEFMFHCTVIYSKTPPSKRLPRNEYQVPRFALSVENLTMIGPDNCYPCFTIAKTNEVMQIREEIESYGLTDPWPEYKPHMTLSYAKESVVPDFFRLTLPQFPIIVDTVKVTDVASQMVDNPSFIQWLRKRDF